VSECFDLAARRHQGINSTLLPNFLQAWNFNYFFANKTASDIICAAAPLALDKRRKKSIDAPTVVCIGKHNNTYTPRPSFLAALPVFPSVKIKVILAGNFANLFRCRANSIMWIRQKEKAYLWALSYFHYIQNFLILL